jgi:hypothetical protein
VADLHRAGRAGKPQPLGQHFAPAWRGVLFQRQQRDQRISGEAPFRTGQAQTMRAWHLHPQAVQPRQGDAEDHALRLQRHAAGQGGVPAF